VSAQSIGLSYMQRKELEARGIDFWTDPKQIRFTYNTEAVLEDVRRGRADVGFIKSGTLESDRDPTKGAWWKILEPRDDLTIQGGKKFPLASTSRLYPEFGLGVMPHVQWEVSWAVMQALAAMNASFPAAMTGGYAGWRVPAASYSDKVSVTELGFAASDTFSSYCLHGTTIHDSFACPEGFVKLSQEGMSSACDKAGTPCPEGYDCLCRPCRAAQDIEIIPVPGGLSLQQILDLYDVEKRNGSVPCEAMAVCGNMTQASNLTLVVFDNLNRRDMIVEYELHDTVEIDVLRQRATPLRSTTSTMISAFLIQVSTRRVGSHILEVWINGTRVPASPLYIDVIPRDCGVNQLSDPVQGYCTCTPTSFQLAGTDQCVRYQTFLLSLFFPLGFIVCVLVYHRFRMQRRKANSHYKLAPGDLSFDFPPTVLAIGCFGPIQLARCKGSRVAVKYLMPDTMSSPRSSLRERRATLELSQEPTVALLDPQMNSQATTTHSGEQTATERQSKPDAAGGTADALLLDGQSSSSSPANSAVTGRARGYAMRQNMLQQGQFSSSMKWAPGNTSPTCGMQMQNLRTHVTAAFVDNTTRPKGLSMGQRLEIQRIVARSGRRSNSPTCSQNSLGHTSSSEGFASMLKRNTNALSNVLTKSLEGSFMLSLTGAANMSDMEADVCRLSMLRHPCVVTVIGAVLERNCQPVLVMEVMDLGNLYNLLHNDTLFLEGEIVFPIIDDIVQVRAPCMCTLKRACMHVCIGMHACIYWHACLDTCMFLDMHACLHVYSFSCNFALVFLHFFYAMYSFTRGMFVCKRPCGGLMCCKSMCVRALLHSPCDHLNTLKSRLSFFGELL
jgi:hypothetical protein